MDEHCANNPAKINRAARLRSPRVTPPRLAADVHTPRLTLHFNRSLLGSEQLLTRPQTPQAGWYRSVGSSNQTKLKTDSAGGPRTCAHAHPSPASQAPADV